MESLHRLSQSVMTAGVITWRQFFPAVARGCLMHVVKVDHLAFLFFSANFGATVTQRLGKPLGVCLFGVLYQKRHEKRLKSSVMPSVFDMRLSIRQVAGR